MNKSNDNNQEDYKGSTSVVGFCITILREMERRFTELDAKARNGGLSESELTELNSLAKTIKEAACFFVF